MLVSAVEAFEVCLCMFINVNVSLNVCSYTCSAGDITSDVSYVAEMAAALFHIRKELRLPESILRHLDTRRRQKRGGGLADRSRLT